MRIVKVPHQRRGMYVAERMVRQLRKGNVGEALFRLWFENNHEHFPHLALSHQGYNPAGLVEVEEKREQLKQSSDPDFSIIPTSNPRARLLGVSVNTQKKPYDAHSTMGGYCIKCPRSYSCYDKHEANLWYNRYNIDNDYPQFRRRYGGIDVVLVTLLLSVDTIYNWIAQEELDEVTALYIQEGIASTSSLGLKSLIEYLGFGRRKQPRKFDMRWLMHSDVANGNVDAFVTGGQSQFGRPREVYCVDMKLARGEPGLLDMLSRLGKA